MPVATQNPETDLLLPLPTGEDWHQHKIHTHYHGFSVPEAQIFVFTYLRAQPAFPLSQGGVCIFQGMNNVEPLDMEYIDYQMTMPWPAVEGKSFTTENGLRIEFIEPGRVVRISYASKDGDTRFDVVQTAITPLIRRSFIMPGEELFHDLEQSYGGSEQFMHCIGELVLHGVHHKVDSYHPRDRSWNQVRVEQAGTIPPTGWTPMRFGDDLVLNVTSSECDETDPVWAGIYDTPTAESNIVFGWMYSTGDDGARSIVRARRRVLEHHPHNHMAIRQELSVEDEHGRTYDFHGEAIASAVVPQWPNLAYRASLYRWEDGQGRITHCDFQEMWFAGFQRAMRERSLAHSRFNGPTSSRPS